MASNAFIDETEFCPPLDATLYRSIVSDYDLSDPAQVIEARGILDSLKANAELEQQTEFDPSGASNPQDETSTTKTGARGRGGAASDSISTSEDTGITNITGSVKSIDLANESARDVPEYEVGIEDLPTQEKEDLLVQLCPEVKKFDVTHALKKNAGNFRKTLDELLNQVWLKQNTTAFKSVDGFFDDDDGNPRQMRQRKGKKKAKKKASQLNSSDSNSTSPEPGKDAVAGPPAPNIWATKASELSFLTSRVLNMNPSLLASFYHHSGASLTSTLSALCKASIDKLIPKLSASDPEVQLSAATLASNFPSLPAQSALTITLLTHPNTSYATDLATALTTAPPPSTPNPLTLLIPSYTRPSLPGSSSPSPPSTSSSHTPVAQPEFLSPLPSSPTALASAAANAHTLKTQRFAQASAAYRAARSDPLMSGAAAFYSSERRTAAAAAKSLQSLAADAISARQTGNTLDLHGVGVEDAVRIVLERVQAWWSERQQEWERAGRVRGEHGGFKIVTGKGGHSSGGAPRLRPAVMKALSGAGWRVDEGEGSGEVVVVGKRKG